jgi:hypothetical protein
MFWGSFRLLRMLWILDPRRRKKEATEALSKDLLMML